MDFYNDDILIEKENIEDLKDRRKARMSAYITAIRNRTGMNKKEFAEWLGIPYRSLQDWELGNSKAPEYIVRLIDYKVRMEQMLKDGKLVYTDKKEEL